MKWLRILGLVVLTVMAVALMALVSSRTGRQTGAEPEATAAVPPARIAVMQVHRETLEVRSTYSGMIRPWERYTLGFELPGRVAALGETASGEPLDDGHRVRRQDVLARLDDRILQARLSEAVARLERTTADMDRARKLQQAHIGAITESDLLARRTELTLAKAEHEEALKNVEDAVLRAPVDGTISRRLINVGESVNAQQPVFEVIENDRVLLIVGVPESDVPEIQARMRRVAEQRELAGDTVNAAPERQFKAYVQLIGRDRFGYERSKRVGTVRRISETADQRTGLFEVEVALANEDRMLRPGMVARVDLVTDYVEGYRVPASAVVFRRRQRASDRSHLTEAYLFAVEQEPAGGHRARRVDLIRWIEQGDDVFVIEGSRPLATIVQRGQHRLIGNEAVQIVSLVSGSPNQAASPPLSQPPAVRAKR
ncbi:MAG: hypothetical protein BMS9Abin04_508 [Planctomycetia bacterium]|nr:MAG: hypothetical protein BMS9Abin04_508 [Planctomycetia bacterium]